MHTLVQQALSLLRGHGKSKEPNGYKSLLRTQYYSVNCTDIFITFRYS